MRLPSWLVNALAGIVGLAFLIDLWARIERPGYRPDEWIGPALTTVLGAALGRWVLTRGRNGNGNGEPP